MPVNSKSELVRTSVRLPKDFNTRLHEAVDLSDETIESFVATAVRNELEARGLGTLKVPQTWGALLAQRFLECLPTPAVIKDGDARIVWCNFAYEDLLGRGRSQLLNQKITNLGLFEQESASRLDHDNRVLRYKGAVDAQQFWEPLTLPSRGVTLLFRAHRFLFQTSLSARTVFLGDISFDWGQMLPGDPRQPSHDLLKRLRQSSVTTDIGQLFEPFLNACPLAIAVKTLDGNMVWCNAEYETLANSTRADMVDVSTRKLFKLQSTHSVLQNEFTVGHSNVWMYATERLPGKEARTSLRFPIVGSSGRPRFIGVISAEFRQDGISSHALRERRPSSRRVSSTPKQKAV